MTELYKRCSKCGNLSYLNSNNEYFCTNESCLLKEKSNTLLKIKAPNFFEKKKSLSKRKKNTGCSFCDKQEVKWEEPRFNFYGTGLKLCQDCYNLIFEGKPKYFCSKCHKPFIPRFEWAKTCYNCWKIAQIDPQKKILIEKVFPESRVESSLNDTNKLQRETFIENLQKQNIQNIELTEMYPCEELQEGSINTSFTNPQYFFEYQNCNTRKKLNNESIAEFDNLDLEQAIEGVCFISLKLIQEKQSFMIFYAEGQRSPHIRVYKLDFLNDLSEFQRLKAVTLFWRTIAGEFFKFLDKSVWTDNHFVPLEFSPHWKYHTPYVCYGGSNYE